MAEDKPLTWGLSLVTYTQMYTKLVTESSNANRKATTAAKTVRTSSQTRTMGRPSTSHAKPAAIIQGAAEAFAKHGYADTRVEDILEVANVSRRTFYRFFRSKEAVFEALFRFGAAQLENELLRAVEQKDVPMVMLERTVRAFLQTLAQWGPVALSMLAEARRPGSQFAHLHVRAVEQMKTLLQKQLEELHTIEADPWYLDALVAAAEYVGTELVLRATTEARTEAERDAIRDRGQNIVIQLAVGAYGSVLAESGSSS